MSTGKYILNAAGEPIAEPDLMKWAQWFEGAERIVKADQIGDSRISTLNSCLAVAKWHLEQMERR